MKKIYLLLTLIIFISSCEKDEIPTPLAKEAKQKTGVKSVEFKDIPDKILKNLTGKKISKQHKNSVNFGQVRKDIQAYINKDKTGITYTIALTGLNKNSKSNGDLYFDNLVVHELPDGEIEQYVFRYIPDISWYEGSRDLKNYSGGITFFELNGNKLGQIKLIHGQIEKQDSTATKTACTTFKLDDVVCIDAGDTGSPYCTYYYIRSCGGGDPTTGGDGFPDPYDGSGDTDWGDGGGSPSGGGDPGTGGGPAGPGTTPIIDENGELISAECQAGQEPNLFGICEEVDFEIIKDPSFIGTKAECVYDKLEEGSTSFKEAIKKFDGEFPVAHLKFSVDYNLPNTTNAVTNNREDNFILIKINGNTLGNRTTLGLARTLAHEVIHAELYRKVRSVGGQVSINDFPGIYDYYRRYVKNWQHEQMASHYRETIVDILKEFDNNQNSDPFYNSLAWEGLTNTVAWDQLSSTDRTTITNSIDNYKNTGNKNCN